MKPIIALTILLTIFTAPSYGSGSDDETLKPEITPQSEDKEIETLQSEIARHRIIIQALETRLQAMKGEPKPHDSRAFTEIKIDGTSYMVNGKETNMDELLPAIQAQAKGDKSWPILIRYTEATPHTQILAVLEACKKGGFEKFGLTQPTKKSDK